MEPELQRPQVTPEGQAAAGRIAAARRQRNALEPTVEATQLAEPVEPVTVPEPTVATIPQRTGAMVNNVLGSIRSTSERARELEENNQMIGNFVDQSSGFNIQDEQLARFGVTPERIAQLGEIEQQLAGMATQSGLNQVEIQSGGQSSVQGARSLTQEDREAAVRSAGLAAQAAVLQNNINLGRELARDAVNISLADRDFKYKNLIAQNQQLQGQVNEETRQLLQAEQRGYEAELAKDEELKRNVESAVVSGAASQEEIAQLNAILPTHPDPVVEERLQNEAIDQKNALARRIVGRGAGETRALDMQKQRASIGASNASAAASWALANERMSGGETFDSPNGQVQVPTFEDFIAGKEEEMAMSMTPAAQEEFRKEYEDEVSVMEQAVRVSSLSPVAQEIVNNPQAYYDLTPSVRGEIFEELARKGIDTNAVISGKKKSLPATQAENLSQASGVRNDVEKLYGMLQDLPGTGPISGRLQGLNPYHPQRVAIDAQITRIIPGLARGIFQEVGVLTDADMERYRKTLANPNMTDEQIELLHNDTMSKIDQSINTTLGTFDSLGYNTGTFRENMGVASSAAPTMSVDDAYEQYLQITNTQ